jgi:mannose-6-phosphate isomerase
MEIVKLYPECKDNIWGGVKLREKYGKQTDKTPVAESWELSFHKDGPTRLDSGKTLQETATAADLGGNCEGFPFFPMLTKFIDAKADLSVQVHPSDAMLWNMKTALERRKCGISWKPTRARGFTWASRKK